MSKLLFITIAGNTVGLGHLNRCLSLAGHASHKNFSSQFLLFADDEAALRVEQAGYDCLNYPIASLTPQCIKEYLDKAKQIEAVIIDFSHPIILQQEEKISALLRSIYDDVQNVILIDSMGEQALSTRIPNLPVSVVVVPYAGAERKSGSWQYLAGPTYAILSSEYTGLKKRILNEKAHRILISCGGSDPRNFTPLVLKGIENLVEKLNVRVIVGPLFDEKLKHTLQNIVANSKHEIVLIDAPQTLVSHMLWCDLAIATSGLIKYELAATSTPSILISIDEFHHRVNQPFAAIGSTVDLGTKITAELMAEHVSHLLANYDIRLTMAAVGHQAIDGNGAERLMKDIISNIRVTDKNLT